jgi:hypothetical protein
MRRGKKKRERTNLRFQVIVMKLLRKKSSDPIASVERQQQQQQQQQNTNAKTKNERNSDKDEGERERERERERSARGSLFQRSQVPNS